MRTLLSTKKSNRQLKKLAEAVKHWTNVCRAQARTSLMKRANIDGAGDSVPFEQAFSNLAHAYLDDKAPGLREYELGFQLLEKNEDNDKAVGVFGFKVGPQMLFAPVFFLNGELKGHELLYLKESDTFVPLKENWINYVLNRKPNILGEETNKDVSAVGVERPNMDLFRESPGKYASFSEPWLREGMPGLANALINSFSGDYEMVTPSLIKESADMAMRFISLMDNQPVLAKSFVQLYGDRFVKEAIDTARTLETVRPIRPTTTPRRILTRSVWHEEETDPVKTGSLKIWTYDGDRPKDFTDKQAAELKRDGVYIDDNREDASKAYRVQKPLTLQNPDESGIYDVVTKPNDFAKCLVLIGTYGRRGRKPVAALVRLENEGSNGAKAWCHKHPGDLFHVVKHENDEYREFLNDLPTASDGLKKGSSYILIAPNGQGTQVFEVERSGSTSGDDKRYDIWWKGSYDNARPDHLPPMYEDRYAYDRGIGDITSISIGAKGGTKPLSRQNVLYFPSGTKVLKVKDSPQDEHTHDYSSESDPPPLEPGNHIDLQLGLYKASHELQVTHDGYEVTLNKSRMPAKAAFVSLIRDYGLREKAAADMLNLTARKKAQRFRIKYAQPYGLLQSGPSAPGMPEPPMGPDTMFGSGAPMQSYMEQEIPVEGMTTAQPGQYNAAAPPDPQLTAQLEQAAATGQKEVLDTSMLAGLLKGTRDDTLIDKYLGDLVKGLDRIGRLLFNYYWHHDEFEARYGSSDLPELEDSLRNSFEDLGDLVLFLKQKTIEPYPGMGTEVDLGPSAEG